MNNVDKSITETEETSEKNVVLMLSNRLRIEVENDSHFKINGEVQEIEVGVESKNTPLILAKERMRKEYGRLLSKPYENVLFLSGAGTSIMSGGKAMVQLWDAIFTTGHTFGPFLKLVGIEEPKDDIGKDLENLLSRANKVLSVASESKNIEVISGGIKTIQGQIKSLCNLTFDKEKSAHLKLINRLTSRKMKYPRVKIFTLNYDTLFEQAAAEGRFVVVDGFSFTQPAYFSGEFYDYDVVKRGIQRVNDDENFIPKVFQLYKPHGSLHWSKNDRGMIVAGDIYNPAEDPLMVFPNSDKYESSYDQPFFEMMSKFQQSVRNKNTLLICSGFSFGDKHFKNVVLEAAKGNPGLTVLIAMSGFVDNENVSDFVDLVKTQNNVVLISDYFEDFTENYPFAGDYEHETIQ